MDNCGRFVFYNNTFFFAKNQKQNNRHYVTYYIISMVYTLIDHSSRPISARGFALIAKRESERFIQTFNQSCYEGVPLGVKGGAVVRALASHQ